MVSRTGRTDSDYSPSPSDSRDFRETIMNNRSLPLQLLPPHPPLLPTAHTTTPTTLPPPLPPLLLPAAATASTTLAFPLVFYIVQSVRPEASDWTGLNLGSPSGGSVRTDWSKKIREPANKNPHALSLANFNARHWPLRFA